MSSPSSTPTIREIQKGDKERLIKWVKAANAQSDHQSIQKIVNDLWTRIKVPQNNHHKIKINVDVYKETLNKLQHESKTAKGSLMMWWGSRNTKIPSTIQSQQQNRNGILLHLVMIMIAAICVAINPPILNQQIFIH